MSQEFDFGQNWKKYLDADFNESRLKKASGSLRDLLHVNDLTGKTFLDAGCGSGIFSLAAYKLGAKKVISFDVNPKSVECCQKLKEAAGNPDNWEILQGSLIEDGFMAVLPEADVVYCWGVAHHTGEMWKALGNLLPRLKDDGLLVVAIYNKVDGFWSSERWIKIKRFYNQGGIVRKKIMEFFYLAYHFFRLVVRFKNPFRVIRNYRSRGMAWKADLIDWLGGYPYEYATINEIFTFFHDRYGLNLENIKSTNYSGCNQFVFRKEN